MASLTSSMRDTDEPTDSFRRMIDVMQDGAAATDVNGHIVHVNNALCDLFEYRRDELIGLHVGLLDAAHVPLGRSSPLAVAIDRQSTWELHSLGICKDGTTFPMTMRMAQIAFVRERFDGYVVTYRECNVFDSACCADACPQLKPFDKQRVISALSHEFRTPLATIIGFADLVACLPELPATGHDFVQAITVSAERISELVESMIELAHTRTEQANLAFAPYELRTRLRRLTRETFARLRRRGIEWELRVTSEVPQCIVVDAEKMERILTLLLENSEKFTESGKVGMRVTRSAISEELLDIHVTDTGIGYDPSQASHIFEPFRQAEEGLNRRFNGLGIGLTLAQQLAKQLGGQLQTSSSPGRGSVFTLTLPMRKDSE